VTVKEAFDNFIMSRVLANLSPKTVSNYRDFCLPFISFLGSDMVMSSCDRAAVNQYLILVINKPIAKASKATYINHLRIFLKWCEKEYGGFDVEASSIKVPKAYKKVVRVYSDEEIKTIFETITSEGEWLTLRNKAIIALMLDSGLRQAEVCTLKLANVYMDSHYAKVCGKGEKERSVPLGQATIEFMKKYMALCPYSSDNVFVSRRGEHLTCDAVKHVMSKIGIKLPFEFSSHRLRHNFATNYCLNQYSEHGQVDIYRLMILMGHEDIETTRRYLHLANQIIATRTNISHIDNILLQKFDRIKGEGYDDYCGVCGNRQNNDGASAPG
jgi:site-specific recombinase XerD